MTALLIRRVRKTLVEVAGEIIVAVEEASSAEEIVKGGESVLDQDQVADTAPPHHRLRPLILVTEILLRDITVAEIVIEIAIIGIGAIIVVVVSVAIKETGEIEAKEIKRKGMVTVIVQDIVIALNALLHLLLPHPQHLKKKESFFWEP